MFILFRRKKGDKENNAKTDIIIYHVATLNQNNGDGCCINNLDTI
jgi:hypothetical protein